MMICKEFLHVTIENLLYIEFSALTHYRLANTDDKINALTLNLLRNLFIQIVFFQFTLQDIRQDNDALLSMMLLIHKVECNRKCIEIRVITIVDYLAVIYSRLQFHTHGDWCELRHLLLYNSIGNIEFQGSKPAMYRIFNRSIISKRNRNFHIRFAISDECLYRSDIFFFFNGINQNVSVLIISAPSKRSDIQFIDCFFNFLMIKAIYQRIDIVKKF